MGAWGRLGRVWKAGLLVGAGAAGGAAAVAVASVPDSNGVIHACYQVTPGSTVPVTTPNLRIIDLAANQKCNTVALGMTGNEVSIAWNQQGPPGQQGQQGPPAKPVTIAGGNTFTIGGSVVTVGAPSGLTINVPPVGPGSPPIGTATVDGLGSFSILSLGLGSASAAARASIHDIVITKTVDKSSPSLQLACASGKHFTKAILQLQKGPRVYLEYTLNNVLVSGFQLSGHGAAKPTETVTLNFTSLVINYTKQRR